MPYPLVFGALTVVVVYQLWKLQHGLSRNIALAKSSGLPYVVSPVNVYGMFWLITFGLWLPTIKRFLPASLRGVWVDILHPEWGYLIGHKPYRELGSDMFLVVSPAKIYCFVADAEALIQITTRRTDFPKPLEMYKSLDLYGKNLVSTEGADWRVHRRLAAPSFGEKNNKLVFTESIHHANSLLSLWTESKDGKSKTIEDPSAGAMNLALYVISSAGFDVRVIWPHEEGKETTKRKGAGESMFVGSEPPPGYTMSYREALSTLLHNMMWTQILPLSLLRKSPFKLHRDVGTALVDWGKYMDELYELKKSQVAAGDGKAGMDLLDSLIRGSGIVDDKETSQLDKSDILGNAFVLMLAGHETTANTLHFSLVYLAQNPESQKHLQEDIDKIMEGKPTEEWNYEDHFQKLFGGMTAAVMNETLRLLQPVINIPKSTPPGRPQQLVIGGEQYTIPGGSTVLLSGAVHRNPRYWPAPPGATEEEAAQDVNHFRPERWLAKSQGTDQFVDINYEDEELRGPSGEDTSSQLFKPVKGSYIPFSDGQRSCIGRRFAQVEVIAVLAVIFAGYSVELAVDEFATDEEVEKMPKAGSARKKIYKMACDRADRMLREKCASIITLQLRGVTIPIRIVPRGQERFIYN